MNNFNNVSELIFKLGGTGYVSKLLKTNPSTISNWKKNNKVPSSYLNRLQILLNENHLNSSNTLLDNLNLKKITPQILIIISGGVSCYKVLELLRVFHKVNFNINVVMTKSAQKFISPLLITSLINKQCYTKLFSSKENENMNHINLARDNDLILVAPCTANFIAKMCYGIADDLASNIILAANSKILIAPSMNPYMWENEATQNNIKILKERGINFIEPNSGEMACGESGTGRLPEINEIFVFTKKLLTKTNETKNNGITNLKVLITAGPTQEQIDPIRYISNNSSGKQGYAIAKNFKQNGAKVILISGPTNIEAPIVDEFINVKSSKEMLSEVEKNLDCDVFVSTAAVCDWKFLPYDSQNKKISMDEKLKKNKNMIFKTENNPDILEFVSSHSNRPKLVVGFAAETSNLVKNASSKLISKKLDLIVANLINKKNTVFGSEYNEIAIIDDKQNIQKTSKLKKIDIAKIVVDKIYEMHKIKNVKSFNRKSIKI